jgi:glucose/arabinose dehydrogenase
MRGNTTKGQHFGSRIVFDNEGYLYSQQENAAEFVNPQDITRDNGKFTASMRMEEFLQTTLCRGNRCKEAIYSYAPQSTRISQTQLQALFGIKSTDRKAETKSTS